MAAAYYLAEADVSTVVLERKLSTGGGIWGGGAGQSVVVVEDTDIFDELGVRHEPHGALHAADAVELAGVLTVRAVQSGARVFNLTDVEDLVVKEGAVRGVVINNMAITMAGLHVDPVCMGARVVVDATGHDAELVEVLRGKNRDFLPEGIGHGSMDVEPAEQGVVDRTGEVFPGLYVAGMSVCTVYGLPRMGPIFGGMLNSGRRAAGMIRQALAGQQ